MKQTVKPCKKKSDISNLWTPVDDSSRCCWRQASSVIWSEPTLLTHGRISQALRQGLPKEYNDEARRDLQMSGELDRNWKLYSVHLLQYYSAIWWNWSSGTISIIKLIPKPFISKGLMPWMLHSADEWTPSTVQSTEAANGWAWRQEAKAPIT